MYMTVHLSHFYSHMPTGKLAAYHLAPRFFIVFSSLLEKSREMTNWPAFEDGAAPEPHSLW